MYACVFQLGVTWTAARTARVRRGTVSVSRAGTDSCVTSEHVIPAAVNTDSARTALVSVCRDGTDNTAAYVSVTDSSSGGPLLNRRFDVHTYLKQRM